MWLSYGPVLISPNGGRDFTEQPILTRVTNSKEEREGLETNPRL